MLIPYHTNPISPILSITVYSQTFTFLTHRRSFTRTHPLIILSHTPPSHSPTPPAFLTCTPGLSSLSRTHPSSHYLSLIVLYHSHTQPYSPALSNSNSRRLHYRSLIMLYHSLATHTFLSLTYILSFHSLTHS